MANTSGSEVDVTNSRYFREANRKTSYSLENFVEEAVKYMNDGNTNGGNVYRVNPYRLFVDFSYSYRVRLVNLKYISKNRKTMRDVLFHGLFNTFDYLYTKSYACQATSGHMVRTVNVFLTFAGIGLFHTSRTEAYNDTDINITYTLLCCTATLSTLECMSAWFKPNFTLECIMSAWFKPIFSSFVMKILPSPDQVAQYNLIWYLSCNKMSRPCCMFRNKLPRWLEALIVGCEDFLDRAFCMEPCKDLGLSDLVFDHVEHGWKNKITDQKTYREFNDNRGQLTLNKYLHESQKTEGNNQLLNKALHRSICKPFDETVLLWHLATDFCFYMEATSPSDKATATHCTQISNYMAYLLFVKPEMLLPGARYGLFKVAYHELKDIIKGENDLQQGKGPKDLAKKIVDKMEKMPCREKETHLIMEAWRLAKELEGLAKTRRDGKTVVWKLIQGVWVEMLCFSASRSRGFLHAKSLGMGGEYLSRVWLLLLWYMGMETFVVRLQRTGLEEEGDMSTSVHAEEKSSPAASDPGAATTGDAV